MTDTQLNEPVSSGMAPKKNRPWWKFLLIFLAIPIGAAALTVGVYLRMAIAKDSKRQLAESRNFVLPQLLDQPHRTSSASQLAQPVKDSWPNKPLPAAPPQQYPSPNPPQSYGPNNAEFRQATPYLAPVRFTDNKGRVTTRYEEVTRFGTPPTPPTATWDPMNAGFPQQSSHNHDRRVLELVGELRSLQGNNTDDSQVESKLAELRRMLEEEFSQMHKRQSDEIDAATKRLDALRKIHDERGSNQSQIVQRRIDQLIGKSNPLDWYMNPYPTTVPGDFSTPYSTLPGQQISGLPNSNQATPGLVEMDPLDPSARRVPGMYAQPNGFVPSPSPAPPSFLPPNDDSANQRIIEQMPISSRASVLPTDASLSTRPNLPPNPQNSSAESLLNRLNEVFAVISSAGEANLSVQAKKRILDTNTKLHNQGQVPGDLMQRAKDELESATQKSRVLKAQLDAMQRTLNLEADAAKERLIATKKSMESTKGTEAAETAARSEMSKAQTVSDAANELLYQFEEAVKLLHSDTTAEPNPTAPVQQTPDSDSTPPKLETQDDPNNIPT